MARTSDIQSATSQLFINLADNPFLDHGERDFGKVVEGMDVVAQIAAVPTGKVKGCQDAPLQAAVIESARRADD